MTADRGIRGSIVRHAFKLGVAAVVCLLGMALLMPPTPPVTWAAAAPDGWVSLRACARVGGGPLGGSTATAFCVGQRDGSAYLLTAAHVVPKGEPRAYEFFTAHTPDKPARTLTGGEVVVRLPEADVALVRLPVGASPVPTLRLATVGERPTRYPQVALSIGCPEGRLVECRGETIAAKKLVRRAEGGAAFYWQVSTPPIGGMSGGPLLSTAGKVIGVCAAAQDGKGYYAHLDEVLYGLKQNGYDWLTRP